MDNLTLVVPGFYYSGDSAERHTNKMVKMIESMGIKLWHTSSVMDTLMGMMQKHFKNMYGKGAKMIDVTNVNQITKTMNQLFLQK